MDNRPKNLNDPVNPGRSEGSENEGDEGSEEEEVYDVGRLCALRVRLYHAMVHWKGIYIYPQSVLNNPNNPLITL